jgi:trehalose synthase
MIELKEEDWHLIPDVQPGRHAVNLPPHVVDQLKDKGYIVGQLRRVIFFEPGIKETDWSASDVVVGVDGVARRWVYLHYFKEGQPSLNWLDPSFAAPQMIIGDALHSIDVLGARGLRLDANGFLGVERQASGPAWSEGHPLSVVGNQLIGGMIRKAGAFSFQELNLTVDDIAAMSKGGADLSYDFITRPAYHHAVVTGSTEFLRLMLRTVHEYGIDPRTTTSSPLSSSTSGPCTQTTSSPWRAIPGRATSCGSTCGRSCTRSSRASTRPTICAS